MPKINIDDIQLVNYFLPAIEVAAIPSHAPNEETMTIFSINAQIEEMEDERDFAINVEVRTDMEESSNPPYKFRLFGVAFFHITCEEFDRDNAREACYKIGHQVVFGALREQLATITSRGPWQAVQLRVVPAPELETETDESNRFDEVPKSEN